MKITVTVGNSTNNIRGSRVSIYTDNSQLVDSFIVPKRSGIQYCKKYPNGIYGRRYLSAIEDAKAIESSEDDKRKKDMCIYCYAENCSQLVPALDDDTEWYDLAKEHNPNCEWITTRAHMV